MDTDLREQIAAHVAAARVTNDFLRLNGARDAAQRGDDLLDQLEGVLAGLPERSFTVAEAARASGMHPKSIYRKVKRGDVGSQMMRGGAVRLTLRDVRGLSGRRRVAADHAAAILARYCAPHG